MAATVCTQHLVIPTFNAELVPEHDAGPCHQPAVSRLSITHDGQRCGCPGSCCLLDADTGAALTPYTQVEWFCDVHDVECQPARAAGGNPAWHYTRL